MNTPWRDIAVSDAHVHFLSSRFFAALSEQKGASIDQDLANLGIEAPDQTSEQLAGRWVQELDRHTVDNIALIASNPGDEDSVIAAVRAHPDRFFGYFQLDPTQPDASQRASAALDAGMSAICFFPAMHRYSMHDERVISVLESVSARSGVVIFVHCGVLSVGIRGKLGLPSRFDMRFANPLDLHALALRYPQFTFVIPHFGAGFFRETLMVADLCPNVYIDTSSSNSWIKYQVPIMDVRDAFRRSLDVLGAHRLLFGTDSSSFPRGWLRSVFDAQVNLLFDLGIGSDDAELIFGANLRRILKHR